MDVELKALEERIALVAQFCQTLRAENTQLRQQLAAAQNECKQLSEKVASAKGRLEELLQRIPENAE